MPRCWPIPVRLLRAVWSVVRTAHSAVSAPRILRSLLPAVLLAVPLWAQPAASPAAAATKQTLADLIRHDPGATGLSAETAAQVQAFLADRSQPARDRLEVTIVFAQAGLQRRVFTARADRLQAHEDHAADLIRDFPDQPEGYGYRLSLAKAESPLQARLLAQSLLDAPAPDAIKAGAQRVLARLELAGTALRLAGVEAAVAAARGRPLFLYAWTAQDAGVLAAVRRLAATDGFAFIGINLDPEPNAAARALAAGLPGPQFYDGGGLDGPLARQLQLTMLVALYLIDADGMIRDLDAHRDPAAALARLTGGNGR